MYPRATRRSAGRTISRLAPLAAGLIALLAYAPDVAPGLLGGDSGELQMAAWLAGLAHPTGYPLYLLMGWAWSHALAPFGVGPPAALNWLSALFGAAAVAVTALAGRAAQQRVLRAASLPPAASSGGAWLAALFAIAFGLTATVRSQALIAEVYTLHALLLALLLWALLRGGCLPLIGLLYGLALAHHRTAVLWAPAILLFIWLDRRGSFRLRDLGLALLLAAAPQALYLYIPWRGPLTAYLHQSLAPGQTLVLYDGSWRAFWEHISGTVFRGELGAGGEPAARMALLARLAGQQIGYDALWPLLLLGALGAVGWLIHRKAWPVVALLGLGALATVAFGLAYGIGDVEVMFIPAWLALALLAQLPVAGFLARYPAGAGRVSVALAAVAALPLLIGLATSGTGHPAAVMPDARTAWETLLAAPPPSGAILLSNDRNEMVPLWYLQFVEGRRPDLLGLFPLVTQRPEHADVGALAAAALETGRPVRLVKPMPGLELRFDLAAAEAPLIAVVGPAPLPSRRPSESEVTPDLSIRGWAADPHPLTPGSLLTVTLGWAVMRPLPADLTTYVHLLDAGGTLVAQSDHQAGGRYYPSQLWPVGALLRDAHRLELPEALAPGLYQLRAGAYRRHGNDTVPFGREIAIGRVTTARAAGAGVADGEPAAWLPFGEPEVVELTGYRVDMREAGAAFPPGAVLPLTLLWRALDFPDRAYTTFVHVVAVGDEQPVTQVDTALGPGDYPADVWRPDDVVTQELDVPLPSVPGRYRLLFGLYDPSTGLRLPVDGSDHMVLTEIVVE